MKFNTIEEAIQDLKQGKMIIVSDDENRENEGDIIFPAQNITHNEINFMLNHARGLICLSLTSQKAKTLGLKDMVEKEGLADKFIIKSAATSREEIGNPVHYGTQNVLNQMGINCSGKTARQITQRDYEEYDYILLMDKNNLRNMTRMFGTLDNKVKLLLEYANSSRDIADTWYSYCARYDSVALLP